MRVEDPNMGPRHSLPHKKPSDVAPPTSELSLSMGIEDPSAELALAEILAERLQRPIRVLVAGAAGCSALALLSKPCVAEVHAVDLNAAQVHLIDLKRASIACLTAAEQTQFFEANDDVDSDERLKLYARVRDHLDVDAREFWDARQAQLAYGVGRVGRFEALLFDLRQSLKDNELDPLTAPAKALGSPTWNKAFAKHFERSRIAQSLGSAWVGYTDRDVPKHFANVMANSLRRYAKADNYFLTSALKGTFDDEQKPLWLDAGAQQRMKDEGLDRLHLHVGTFAGTMEQLGADAPFDLIVMSSLGDSLPFTEMNRLYSKAKAAISDGGAVLARRFTSHRPVAASVQRIFQVDAALSSALQTSSLSSFNDELVVGFAA